LSRSEPSDWDAATYDRVCDPQARWAATVIDRIEGRPERILDAGSGSGRVTEMLLRRFPDAHVVAVDASSSMLAEARRRLAPFESRVSFVPGDLLEPISIDEPVDAIFSNAVFHWIGDHATLFRNLRDVLRPGGQLVAQWGGSGNVSRVIQATLDVDGRAVGPQPPSANFATTGQTAARLDAAGFVDVNVWLYPAPASFETREAFEEYLRTVCLRCHLDLVPADESDAFVRAVADRLPDRTIDYVRLNAVARRSD
jgi:trans-aconitate 2-methyltransferase